MIDRPPAYDVYFVLWSIGDRAEPNTADWIAAWAQVVAALGGLAGFTALVIELWRRRSRRKRPPVGLLEGLQWLDEAAATIIALGGQESLWFLEPEHQRHERLLVILNGQIVDDELNDLVGAARAHYNTAWALAPGQGGLQRVENRPRLQRQVEAAQNVQTACRRAIERTNELLRKYAE